MIAQTLFGVSALAAARLFGLTVLAGVTAGVVALGYRWYFRDRVPTGLAVLAAVASVALYLNTKSAVTQVLAGQSELFEMNVVLFNSAAFALATAVGPVGQRTGDRIAVSAFAAAGAREVTGEVSQLVQAVGRVVAVTLPEDVGDIEEYEPAEASVKDDIAGKTLIFPRRLTVEELRERVVNRLKDDHDVGYVDVEMEPDGTVTYLAVGRRLAGIGPTLGPGTAAVAVTADPPNSASAGDVVQVWTTGETPERVATAELRATAGDTVTLALDEADAERVAGGRYRLLTLPSTPSADREFAALLRAADETMAAIRVAPDGPLAGTRLRDVEATVVAVRPQDGPVEPIPSRDRRLAGNDWLYVVARPETLRRIEADAGGAPGESGGS
ncbi:potassium transporter TrkA [Salarchaeum japonicum]|uniref:RCK C-terminal domain-containing protein n=1 Tax=Salarchaeum japonicum TaxID=555573 RepID=A0AAV3SYU2_9EURY|nr:potassium transporter TrkA [Salarchaeum japonicum]